VDAGGGGVIGNGVGSSRKAGGFPAPCQGSRRPFRLPSSTISSSLISLASPPPLLLLPVYLGIDFFLKPPPKTCPNGDRNPREERTHLKMILIKLIRESGGLRASATTGCSP
jgi:hypothetical protein